MISAGGGISAVTAPGNTIFGYRFRRFYSLAPYIHGGYQRIFDPAAYKTNYDREMVFGAGLLNTFRLTDRLSLTLDLRAVSSLREPSSLTSTSAVMRGG